MIALRRALLPCSSLARIFNAGSGVTRNAWLIWGAVVFWVPYRLYSNYILNAFYHFGAWFLDAGLFAQLLWRNDWALTTPYIRGNFSYLGVHFSPLLCLVSQLSHHLPTQRVEFFAGFIAGIYALLGLTMFYAFSRCVNPRNQLHMAGLALLATGVSFNAVVMNGVGDHHFEFAIPLGIMWFLLCRAAQRRWLSLLAFTFTLSLREDAGLHLAIVLGCLAWLRYREERSARAIKWELGIIAYALSYTLLALVIKYEICQIYQVPKSDNNFVYIYFGTPVYAHLSWPLLRERLGFLFTQRSYLWIGFLVTLAWARRLRDPYLAVGFISCLPWLALSMLARSNGASHLIAHYGFPFVLAFGWPLIGALWRHGFPMPLRQAREVFFLQMIMIVIGLIVWDANAMRPAFGPVAAARGGSYRLQGGTDNRKLTQSFIDKIQSSSDVLGNVEVDTRIASLAIGPVNGRNLLSPGYTSKPIDTLVYMPPLREPGREIMRQQISKNLLIFHYCIPGVPICLFTDRALQQLGLFSSLLAEKPADTSSLGR